MSRSTTESDRWIVHICECKHVCQNQMTHDTTIDWLWVYIYTKNSLLYLDACGANWNTRLLIKSWWQLKCIKYVKMCTVIMTNENSLIAVPRSSGFSTATNRPNWKNRVQTTTQRQQKKYNICHRPSSTCDTKVKCKKNKKKEKKNA